MIDASHAGWALLLGSLLGLLGCGSLIVCEGPACKGGGGSSAAASGSDGGAAPGVGGAAVGGAGVGGAICGNGVLEDGEACDGADFLGEPKCAAAVCLASCVLDESGCEPFCGDGLVQGEELCDGTQLAGASCEELVLGSPGGELACASDCASYDLSRCTIPSNCGNGAIDPGETCDGTSFGGLTCESFGFGFGQLACNASCNVVANGCSSCGNGVINSGEQCDGRDLGGLSCVALGYGGGTLSCAPNCTYDVAGCTS